MRVTRMSPTHRKCLRLLICALVLPALVPSAYANAASTTTVVGGPVVSDTTWTLTRSPYVVAESVQVMVGVTLTIEPGVVVQFNTGKQLQVDGTLVARGTRSDYITFTSAQADRGDWGQIRFTSNSTDALFDLGGDYIGGSIMEYCIVEYGGGDGLGTNGTIEITEAAPLIDDCIVRDNLDTGIHSAGTSSRKPTIRDCFVYRNWGADYEKGQARGGGIYAEYSIVENNYVSSNWAYKGAGIYATLYMRLSKVRSGAIGSRFALLTSLPLPAGSCLAVDYTCI